MKELNLNATQTGLLASAGMFGMMFGALLFGMLSEHDELAGFIGTTRPKVTEHLSNFSRKGLIEKGRGYIVIKNLEGLRKISRH